MPGIRDCAIFGIPDEEFGESLCAHIDVDPDTIRNEEEVREWLRKRVAGFKVPGQTVFNDQLPREEFVTRIGRILYGRYDPHHLNGALRLKGLYPRI